MAKNLRNIVLPSRGPQKQLQKHKKMTSVKTPKDGERKKRKKFHDHLKI